jgi:hypothetical protein
MGDREAAAVSRYELESQELLRSFRSWTWQLDVVDRELEGCSHPDRKDQLHRQRTRITEALAATRARLTACQDRRRQGATSVTAW